MGFGSTVNTTEVGGQTWVCFRQDCNWMRPLLRQCLERVALEPRAYSAETMKLQKICWLLACLTCCAALWGCAAQPSIAVDNAEDPASAYASLRAAGGRVMRLQPEASRLRIFVFRGGRATSLGHNHVLTAPEFDGYFYLPEGDMSGARFDLRFRLDKLVFDLPAERLDAGPAFAAVISDAAIAVTREHMLGPDNMQADRYPFVRIRSLDIRGEAPRFAARIAIDMHGQTREMLVPLTVTGLPQRVSASGSLVLRQSDFGVQPYSVMAGLLAVQDDVVVEFNLVGE